MTNHNRTRAKGIVGIVGVLCASLCAAFVAAWAGGRSDLLKPDGPHTRDAVLGVVALGTEISRAQTIMETEGFDCAMRFDEEFVESSPGGGPPIVHPPADFLWCDSGERFTLSPFVTKRWQVILVVEDGSIAHVSASVGLTGL